MEYKKQYTPEVLDEAALRYATVGKDLTNEELAEYPYCKEAFDGFKAGAEWRDRQLNWARDLVQAGIDKPEEAVNILKRLKELIQLLP